MLCKHPAVLRINRFLNSPVYILLICLLALVSNVFSLELWVYCAYALIGLYVCLLADDLLPFVPIVLVCYFTASKANNPGSNAEPIFALNRGGLLIGGMVALCLIALIVRMIRDKDIGFGPLIRTRRTLLPGMLILGIAYMLGGIGSRAYPDLGAKNLIFGLLQLAVIALPYLIFSSAVKWDKAPKAYLGWCGFGTGCLLFLQIIWIYIDNAVVQNGIIHRDLIFTGWAMHNNLGGLQAMMIPFGFYLGVNSRKDWLGILAGSVFLLGACMTSSRSSILCGSAIWLICVCLTLKLGKHRKGSFVALGCLLAVAVALAAVFHRQLADLFTDILDRGLDPNYRNEIWGEGLKQFAKYPIFGASFYPTGDVPYDWSTVASFSSFFPPRWHNTVVQLLASCGTVGLLAYGFHRLQTFRLFWKRRSREHYFLACAILVLLTTSLLDCHFFNIGPTLFLSLIHI